MNELILQLRTVRQETLIPSGQRKLYVTLTKCFNYVLNVYHVWENSNTPCCRSAKCKIHHTYFYTLCNTRTISCRVYVCVIRRISSFVQKFHVVARNEGSITTRQEFNAEKMFMSTITSGTNATIYIINKLQYTLLSRRDTLRSIIINIKVTKPYHNQTQSQLG